MTIFLNLRDRGADGCFNSIVGDKNEGRGCARCFLSLPSALDDAFDGDFLIVQHTGNGGNGAGAGDKLKRHIVKPSVAFFGACL